MNIRRASALLLACCALAQAPMAAAETSAEVPFGHGTLLLPVPDGFADPSATPPASFDAIQHSLPEGVRLMAVIMDEDFLARVAEGERAHLSRYFLVHTDPALETPGIPRAAFDRIKADLRQNAQAVLRANAKQANAGAARASSDVARDTGDPAVSLQSGEEQVLGVFEERPDSIAMASLSTVSVATRDGTRAFRQVMALAYVRIQGRPLTVSVYSDVDSPRDVEWARQALHGWVLRLGALNAARR